MSPRASQSRGDTGAAAGHLVLIQATLARPRNPCPHHSRRLSNGPARGVTRKETEMKITANGRGAVAEQGPRLSLIRTPAQPLRGFVSSSLQEIAAERGVVRGAVEQLRLGPGVCGWGGGGGTHHAGGPGLPRPA